MLGGGGGLLLRLFDDTELELDLESDLCFDYEDSCLNELLTLYDHKFPALNEEF